ncbi:hypothetical protein [Arthrobacter sp. ISL-72]|uniref:hypothetical protein n=1 Tax=Arthrobacter sp. ISL-72 TaxID=2819114 RepID=UPI001BE66F53|nr:hypothetical protein [Arthrobacter sp. ISL-72]MBT2597809.1 hypothetical protein [Arthrobacter sp. ISL-72]
MEDPTTIALNLTFFGTLGVAFVMFIGLFLVFVATLLMAGLGRLVGVTVMAVFRYRPGKTASAGPALAVQPEPASVQTVPAKSTRAGKTTAAGKTKPGRAAGQPPQAGAPRRDAPALAEDWAAAVAEADARAAARAKAAAAPEVKVTVRDLPSPETPVEKVTAVAPLVESATDQHVTVRATPRSFAKPPGPGPTAMLDTGSLVSLAGHPGALKGAPPADHRRAG